MAPWPLPLLACAGAAALLCGAPAAYGRDGTDKTFCSWTCVVFTLQWPAGFCQVTFDVTVVAFVTRRVAPFAASFDAPASSRLRSLNNVSLCTIPERVNGWMIHGLWPMKAQRCCNCWPMFPSDVQELREALEERWPSLLTSRSTFHFWKDEWEKHGVCAACVEGLNSPLRYFQTCLKLRQRFDLDKALDAAGIRPSCQRPYKLAEVQDALLPLVGDRSEIQCVKDHKEREVWFQVKVRLSRNLTLGCDHHGDADDVWERGASKGHPCPAQGSFYFFPINHQRPMQPCG